jgi:hypothetical protein
MQGKSAHQMRYMFQWENDMTFIPEAVPIVFSTDWVEMLAGQDPNREKNDLELMEKQGYRPYARRAVSKETGIFCSPITPPEGCMWSMVPGERTVVARRPSYRGIGPALVSYSEFTDRMRELWRSEAELVLGSREPRVAEIRVTRRSSEPAPVTWPKLLESPSDTPSTYDAWVWESSSEASWEYFSPVSTLSKSLSESRLGKPIKLDHSVWGLLSQLLQKRLLELSLCTGDKPDTSVCSDSQSNPADSDPIMVSQSIDKPDTPVCSDSQSNSVDSDPSRVGQSILRVLQKFQESQNLINVGREMIQSDPNLESIKHLLPEIKAIQKPLSKLLGNIGLAYRQNEESGAFHDSGSDSGFTDTPYYLPMPSVTRRRELGLNPSASSSEFLLRRRQLGLNPSTSSSEYSETSLNRPESKDTQADSPRGDASELIIECSEDPESKNTEDCSPRSDTLPLIIECTDDSGCSKDSSVSESWSWERRMASGFLKSRSKGFIYNILSFGRHGKCDF